MRRALSHRHHGPRALAVAFLALATLVGACTPDFEEAWLVKDLRILAIQADPPEVLVPAGSSAAAPPPVQITPLVVDPRLAASESLRWELWACTPEEVTCDGASQRTLVRSASSPLDQVQASFAATPALIQAAMQKDLYRGFGGVPVKVHLKVWGKGETEPVEGIKRLVYGASDSALLMGSSPLLEPPQPGALSGACRSQGAPCDAGLGCEGSRCVKVPNQNPSITEVTADGDSILPTGLEVLATDEEIELLPVSPKEDVEPYWVFTFSGGTRKLDEYLYYSFFVTSGRKLSPASTGGKPSVFATIKRVEDLTSEWTPEEAGTFSLWVVIRDDRGGTSWVRETLKVR